MAQTDFLRIALPTPLRRLFDYLPPQCIDRKKLIPGVRVKVPFQSRILVGILQEVVKESSVPASKLKQALEILDDSPLLTPDVTAICEWASNYYHYSLGEVFSCAMPVLLRKGGEVQTSPSASLSHEREGENKVLTLNDAQQNAVEKIIAAKNKFNVFLLDGVTGSGKTEVYLRVIDDVLKSGRQVLVLVPEISLTPQTIERFRARFAVPIAALHSSLSDKDRLQSWCDAKSGHARMVIGTRSAIFTAFHDLGLIVIDEEHDTSFKQQDRFRYHARDLGIMRASRLDIPIVLGSATPSLESILNARRDRYVHLTLPMRAGNAALPTYEMIDLRNNKIEEGLSPPLLRAMKNHLQSNNQVMLFLNRRGFAPVLYCTECAWTANCKRCDARMVYHRSPLRLHCHHCDARSAIPKMCPDCHQESLQPVGLGTQRIEEVLAKHFPDVPIIRVDRDSTRKKNALNNLLEQIHREPKAILLGTQMLAKGHHFPNVTLVGVIDADSGLFSADFRAAEQMGQLLLQVSGRAGREEKQGTVMIQTKHPDHPLLQTLIHHGYAKFAEELLNERESALLPPYSYYAVIRAEAHSEQQVDQFLNGLKSVEGGDQVSLLGPLPAFIAKKKGMYCQHLVVRANRRGSLHHFLKQMLDQLEALPKALTVKWVLDVDPVEVG